jgi:gamma-glutamyltranspeptidase/glutathione hydrolase
LNRLSSSSPQVRACAWLLAVVLLAVGCAPTAPRWDLTERMQAAAGGRAMVVSAHPLATAVGVDILRRGGNAADAAVAVGFALAVVHPAAGNLGGGGFLLLRGADGKVAALDYRETAPALATPRMYLDAGGHATEGSLNGPLAAGVPGSVAGLAELLARHGRLPLAELIAPAVALARGGFALDAERCRDIDKESDRLARFPASAAVFLPRGVPPVAGDRLVQEDLARTLEAIAQEGPSAFYRGWIADRIVEEMRRGGGLVSHQDLAGYRPIWRTPVTFTYRGYTVHSMPPPSSGGFTLAEILNMLEEEPPAPRGSVAQQHILAEVMRRAFADRNYYLGDPEFVAMPLADLVSQEYAAGRRADIDPRHASRSEGITPGLAEPTHTTHYTIADAEGMVVSVTTTINSDFGSAALVGGAGFLLNNEMDDFTTVPGQANQFGLIQGEANAIRPGKRMLSAMAPTIVVDPAGQVRLALGSPGGPRIISAVAQVILNVVDYGMSLPAAVAAPRIHHQHLPDRLIYERGGLASANLEQLEAMGHRLEPRDGPIGEVAAILRTPEGWVGVADPRMQGSAAGY